MLRAVLSLIAGISFLTSAFAQTLPPTPQKPTSNDEVVRVTTNLVQIDAVVTDDKGRQVTDLRPEDFEILEDKHPQQITAFAYVPGESRSADLKRNSSKENPKTTAVKNAPPAITVPLKPEEVRRTIVLVVDDLGMSVQSIDLARGALRKFVDEQMQPGDLVAIARTSGGWWEPTSDRQLLYAAIKNVRWISWRNRVGVQALPQYTNITGDGPGADANTFAPDVEGTLVALEYLVEALRELPGRKSVLLFTDSFPFPTNPSGTTVFDPASSSSVGSTIDNTYLSQLTTTKLIHSANTGSVVIHTIDSRGLMTTSPTAADDSPKDSLASSQRQRVPGGSMTQLANGKWLSQVLDERGGLILDTQQRLQDLADATGGVAIKNNNDLYNGITRIMEDLKGFYLIGYRPSESTFRRSKDGSVPYHEITLRVKRPGLHIRSRKGFYGTPVENTTPPPPRTMPEQMVAAINSPFTASGLRTELTALFGNGLSGPFVRVFLHVDARDLPFVDQPDGWHQTVIDVLASSYELNGRISDQMARSDTIRARGNSYERMLRNGLDYELIVPIKNPGAFQMRAAVRDAATKRFGTVFRLVDVPDLKKNRLALSGITLSNRKLITDSIASFWTTAVQPGATLKIGQGVEADPEIQPSAAVRRFQRGMNLEYRYVIYNAHIGRKQFLPELSAQARLFREGQLIKSEETPGPDRDVLQMDLKRLTCKGTLLLTDDLPPGNYVLQILITDPLTKQTAAQWIDFEIVK